MRNAKFGAKALGWGDLVMLGSFFVMQEYLTDVWELSFTSAATLLNIWGGIYRILPLFFLFLADTILGNFLTLALSGILSTMGLILVTVITGLGYGCRKKGEAECVGQLEKAAFITAMALIALGRAARFASSKPFIHDQTITDNKDADADEDEDEDEDETTTNSAPAPAPASWLSQITDSVGTTSVAMLVICFIVFLSMPVAAFFAFPHVKRWYLLFGVSAVCTATATLIYLVSFREYNKPGPRPDGSPITDFVRVLVAAALKKSQTSPTTDDSRLHVREDDEFQKLSTHSPFLRFLDKAAIKLDNDDITGRSWKVCSVSEVESAKILIRMVSVYILYLMGGVVFSIGNTYLVEQATHMNYDIGSWQPPLQLLQLLFILTNLAVLKCYHALNSDTTTTTTTTTTNNNNNNNADDDYTINASFFTTIFSIVCCTVAAAIERRRVHSVRGHNLLDDEGDAKVPMGAYWLLFQVILVGIVKACLLYELSEFHEKEAPKSMERYHDCLVEGVIGLGFMCGALSVYVVGKFSQIGSGKGWFRHTLNKSRLDRYYWVLSVLATLNLLLTIVVGSNYRSIRPLGRAEDVKKTRPKPKKRRRRRRRNSWANILNV